MDHSVGSPDRHWNDSIPYFGTLFFGTYTQIEYQPFSSYPIRDYFLNGSLDHMMISGGDVGFPRPLTSQYMLPFALDMPKTWNMGYCRRHDRRVPTGRLNRAEPRNATEIPLGPDRSAMRWSTKGRMPPDR